MNRIDLTGQKFGRLTVIGRAEGHCMWLCECECGNTCSVRSDHLRKSETKSCGCLSSENSRKSLEVARKLTNERRQREAKFVEERGKMIWTYRPVYQCEVCGKETLHKRFCSRECREIGMAGEREVRTCKECGKEFSVLKSALKTNATGNFCSRKCYEKYLLADDGKNRWSGEFNRAKKKYFSKPQFCAICGSTKNIQIHHILPKRLTNDNTKENLIPLCRKCHPVVEYLTRDIIAVTPEEDYSDMQEILQNILRSRQQVTRTVLLNRITEQRAV